MIDSNIPNNKVANGRFVVMNVCNNAERYFLSSRPVAKQPYLVLFECCLLAGSWQ